MVYRYDKYEKHCVAISKMRLPLPPLEGVDHPSSSARVYVESSLLDLGSSANLVVPELGGEGMRKTPSLRSS
jgi:hypothetical protein